MCIQIVTHNVLDLHKYVSNSIHMAAKVLIIYVKFAKVHLIIFITTGLSDVEIFVHLSAM